MRIWIEQKPRLHWGEDFRLALAEAFGPDFRARTSAITLRVRFVFYDPSPRTHVPVDQVTLRGLVDGLLSELCGYAWENERQLVAVHASKEYGNVSGVEFAW